MSVSRSWSQWLLGFVGAAPGGASEAEEVLRQQYIWESQHAARYRQHAERMQYPQFRDALLRIADDEEKHLNQIAEMLRLLGTEPPGVPTIEPERKNSWQYLLENLEEEQRHSDELLVQAVTIRNEAPAAADLLERIYEEGKHHRKIIRDMLMRSDPQALQVASLLKSF